MAPTIRERLAQRDLEHGHVELGIVGQHADDGAGVDPTAGDLSRQVPVRPVDNHLVRLGEPFGVAKTERASQTVTW
jgi:hypothetical protein